MMMMPLNIIFLLCSGTEGDFVDSVYIISRVNVSHLSLPDDLLVELLVLWISGTILLLLLWVAVGAVETVENIWFGN